MILSILILSLEKRKHFLDRLISVLEPQLTKDIEIIYEIDNGQKSIGKKRNEALLKATGEYICYIDDDDIVSNDYVDKILEALKTKPDCVGINLLHFNDNILGGLTYHSIKYRTWFEQYESNIRLMRYYRNPNHLNPVKKEHALKVMFPEISMGEDKEYSKNILQYLQTEKHIIEPIYYYLYRRNK